MHLNYKPHFCLYTRSLVGDRVFLLGDAKAIAPLFVITRCVNVHVSPCIWFRPAVVHSLEGQPHIQQSGLHHLCTGRLHNTDKGAVASATTQRVEPFPIGRHCRDYCSARTSVLKIDRYVRFDPTNGRLMNCPGCFDSVTNCYLVCCCFEFGNALSACGGG